MQSINGSVAITGSNRGLGLALAENFKKAGFNLILHSRTDSSLSELIKKIGTNPESSFVGDLRETQTLDNFAKVFNKFNGNILINNACMHCPHLPLISCDDKVIDDIIGVNLTACLKLTKRALIASPSTFISIVNINSMVGIEPKLHRTMYGASKAGLKAFSDSLRLELESENRGRVVNVFLSRVRTREEFSEGMNPNRVAMRIVQHLLSDIKSDLLLDGRVDKSLEE